MTRLWQTPEHRNKHASGMLKLRGGKHQFSKLANLHDTETGLIWFNCNLSDMERQLNVPRTSFTKSARLNRTYADRYIAEYTQCSKLPYKLAHLHDIETGLIWFNCNLSEMATQLGFPRSALSNVARKRAAKIGSGIYKNRFIPEYI